MTRPIIFFSDSSTVLGKIFSGDFFVELNSSSSTLFADGFDDNDATIFAAESVDNVGTLNGEARSSDAVVDAATAADVPTGDGTAVGGGDGAFAAKRRQFCLCFF